MNLNGNLFLRNGLGNLIGGTICDNKYQKKAIKKRGQPTFYNFLPKRECKGVRSCFLPLLPFFAQTTDAYLLKMAKNKTGPQGFLETILEVYQKMN